MDTDYTWNEQIKSLEEQIEAFNLCQNQLLESYRNLESKFADQNKQLLDLKKQNKTLEEKIISLTGEQIDHLKREIKLIEVKIDDLNKLINRESELEEVKKSIEENRKYFVELYNSLRISMSQEAAKVNAIRHTLHKKKK